MRLKTFKGGIHPPANKLTSQVPLVTLPAPKRVVIALQQHIGAPCQPLVKVGDLVLMGQKIGEHPATISAPVHSSVSGKVIAIGPVNFSNGKTVDAITIENDFLDTKAEPIGSGKTIAELTDLEIRSMIREAGIVGMGGAGFPTAAKLTVPAGKKIDMLVINGVECEPYLTCDHRVILEQSAVILNGIKALLKATGAGHAYIGVKITMEGAIEKLHEAVLMEKGIDVVPLASKYPQGEERQLIYAITGREVPSGGLPMDVGIVVCNIGTAWAVGHLMETGMPLIERSVTVTGAVKTPSNFMARVGTMVSDLIEAAGGYSEEPGSIIMGGPMTGLPQFTTEIPFTKQNTGILVLTKSEVQPAQMTDCIHCGSCIEACSYRLMPLYLAKYAQAGNTVGLEKYNILDCRECGSCAYVCPAKLPLMHYMRVGKGYVTAKRAADKK